MSDLDLCYLGAADALARFRERSLSPVELMAATIRRSEAVEPEINAFPITDFDRAMEAARAAEDRYARGAPSGPLDGLPVAVKASSDIAGQPATAGSLALAGQMATRTSTVNARVMAGGGIVHARSATPEFSCASFCHSRLWGVTRNPWNRAMTPGGSSGGAGASLAAGTATLATGSDIGGSIRIPASCSGVVGYKPPYGRNPGDPPFNLDPYCHTGPMARSVRDTLLLQNVMAGPDPEDIATLRPKLVLSETFEPIRGWRIAWSVDLGFFDVDPDVRSNTLAALDVFRALGTTVEEVDPGWDASLLNAAGEHLVHLFASSIAPMLVEHADALTPYARAFAEGSARSTAAAYLRTLETAAEAYRRFGPLMERYDLFVCPTTALPAVKADLDPVHETVQVDGREVHPMLGWVMTSPFNTLSRCPVLSVPSGRARNGVPTGIQLVGRTFRDEDVFRAGLAFEEARGAWYRTRSERPVLAG